MIDTTDVAIPASVGHNSSPKKALIKDDLPLLNSPHTKAEIESEETFPIIFDNCSISLSL